MDHFLIDIEEATIRNNNFRQVLFTASHSQLVLMSLKAGEEIGTETHHLDQFIRVEAGRRQCPPQWQGLHAERRERACHTGGD